MRVRPLLVIMLSAVLAASCAPSSRTGDGAVTSENEVPAGPSWRPLAVGPLTARAGSTGVWTGKELVLWGGAECVGTVCEEGQATPLADGAAYDPSRDTWRTLPPATLRARSDAGAVWSGREVLTWGGLGTPGRFFADGAAYNPTSNSWRPIPASPLAPRADPAVAWTGKEMLVWGGFAGTRFYDDGAAYDPAAETWRMLAPSPLGPRFGAARWTGSLWLMWGGAGDTAEGSGPLGDGASYDPASDSWRLLPTAPLKARSGPTRIWTGEELLVVGGSAGSERFDDGAAFRPATNRWRQVPSYPGTPRASFISEWTGREMLLWGGQAGDLLLGNGGAYNPTSNSWRRLPTGKPRSAATAVWTGTELIVWGGFTRLAVVGTLATSADGARLVP